MLACGAGRAATISGQALLDKATDTKLARPKTSADLNEVIKLCQDAIEAGLDEGNTKFANELLASTLTQRAELVCTELFERPVTPNRGRKLVQMAPGRSGADAQDRHRTSRSAIPGRPALRPPGRTGKGARGARRRRAPDRGRPARPRPVADHSRQSARQMPGGGRPISTRRSSSRREIPTSLRFRGMYYLSQNKLEAAIADLDAAIEIDPEDADTHEARGVAHVAGQKLRRGDGKLQQGHRAGARIRRRRYTHRGRVRAIKGDIPAALADVEQALRAAARLGAGPATARQPAGQRRQVRSGAGRSEPAAPGDARQSRAAAANRRAVPGRQAAAKGDRGLRRSAGGGSEERRRPIAAGPTSI